MKKALFLVFAVLSSVVSLTARDFEVVTPSGITFYCDIVTGGAKIVGMNNPSGGPLHLVIPSIVNNGSVNMHVVAIGDNAFGACGRMISVEIPSTVKSIGREAFYRCIGLASVVVPSTIDSIGEDAFLYVPNVEYNGSAQGAPWGALNLNAYHEGQYYYSDSTKSHIVSCERDATEAVIPPTVTSIGGYAFSYCIHIGSVSVDSTIEHLGVNVFSDCLDLESVYFNPRISSIDNGQFAFSGCVNLKRITFGNVVACIPSFFCMGCTSLKEVVIPDNIIEVGSWAIANCTSLVSVVTGDGLTRTNNSLFEGCTSLRNVLLSDNLGYLDINTFKNCTSLENVYLGKHLKNVGAMAFFNCGSLAEIVIPSSVTSIGSKAFSGCRNMGRIVCMSSSVPTTGDMAFDSVATGIEVIVPCNKIGEYSENSQWGRFDSIQGKSYYMVVSTNNPHWGYAVATQQPTCDDNTAVIEAIPEEGCRFVKWSDGNTDNPRQITYNGQGYAYRKAIFESTVGIHRAEVQPDIAVYVSHGSIVIEGAEGETAWVFDIMGRLVLSCEILNSKFEIQNSKLPSGICLVKVGNRETRKIAVLK